MFLADVCRLLDQLPGYHYSAEESGGWITVPCLLAPIRHSGGKDRRPSMSISVGEEPSFAYCHGCGYSHTLEKALIDLFTNNVYPSVGLLALEAQRLENQASSGRFLEWVGGSKKRDAIKETDYSEELYEISGQPWPSHAVDFLESKGVSLKTAKRFKCEFLAKGFEHESFVSKDDEMEPIRQDCILLPILAYRDSRLRCVGAQARPIGESLLKYFSLWRFSSSYYMFGQHLAKYFSERPLALVEGAFDAMHLVQEGLPAVSLNGLSMKKTRIELLRSFNASSILLLLDPDRAGQQAQERMGRQLEKQGVSALSAVCPKDPKYLNKKQLQELNAAIAAHYQT